MGALFTQTIAAARWDEFLAWLRGGDGQLVGTSLNADARLSGSRATQTPAFILVGNEQAGPARGL